MNSGMSAAGQAQTSRDEEGLSAQGHEQTLNPFGVNPPCQFIASPEFFRTDLSGSRPKGAFDGWDPYNILRERL